MNASPRRLILNGHLLVLLPLLLSGCSEMDGQINSLKDKLTNVRETNQTASVELQQLNQRLSLVKRQVSADAVKRTDFEAKSKKSAGTEAVIIEYRKELEKALTDFSASVAKYREKYVTP